MQPGLQAAGLDAFIFPLSGDEEEWGRLAGLCDGFLLTGGHDVNPSLYGESPLNGAVIWNSSRDRLEQFVTRRALRDGKSLLGICRGIQILNVVLGGNLYQDLPAQYHRSRPRDSAAFSESVCHHMHAPYNRRCHDVRILNNTPLQNLIGKETIPVNSIHHQAIRVLSPALQPMAVSEDGLIEAVHMPDRKFVWGIQWHPEYWFRENEDCMRIFRAFAKRMTEE